MGIPSGTKTLDVPKICFAFFVGRMSGTQTDWFGKHITWNSREYTPVVRLFCVPDISGPDFPEKKIVFGRRCQQGLLQASWWWSTIPPKKTQRKAGIWKSEVLMKGRFWNWKPSFLLFILKCWWSILFFIFFSCRIPRFQTRQSPCWVCSKEVLPILECQKNLHKVL